MNKQVLITGATKNIGYQTARYFAKKGFDVHVTSRHEDDSLAVAAKLESDFPGIKAYGYACDISIYADIISLFKNIRKNTDSLDVLIANAACLGIGYDVFTTDEEQFDKIVDTNIKGTFFTCREAGKMLCKNGGSIVLISSVQGKGAVEGRTVYGMTKGAISTLGKYLAYDFAAYNVRVNTAIIGAVHSERWDALDEETLKSRRSNYPLGREATSEEIASAIYYIGAEQTAATGSEITVDSGVTLSILPYSARKNKKHEEYLSEE